MEDHLIIALYFLAVVIWLWALVDLFKSRLKNPLKKGLWLLILLFLPVIGSLLYFQIGNRGTDRRKRKFRPVFRKASAA